MMNMIINKLYYIKNRLCNKYNVYQYFNFPIKVKSNKDYTINEKIVELPFIHGVLNEIGSGKKVLDFGCTRSWLSLSLSSIGYDVYGIDLRDYIFEHPAFNFVKVNIIDFEESEFDYIVSLSVLEHVGLGVYGDRPDDALFKKVLITIHSKLKSDGKFIITVPVGEESIDEFERSFEPDNLENIFKAHRFEIEKKYFFERKDGKFWTINSLNGANEVDNCKEARALHKNGVNGIGCYILKKCMRGIAENE